MKRSCKRSRFVQRLAGGVIIASVMGFAPWVAAVPTLSISDGNTVVTIMDGGPGDTDPAAGAVGFDGSIGVWNLVVVSAITTPVLGSAANPVMDIVVQASSTAAGNLYVAFSESGFTGAGTLAEAISGNVVSGAPETAGALTAGNTANVVGTLNASGSPLNFGNLIANIPVQDMPILAFASGPFPDSAPYSLTEFVIVSSDGPSSTSVDASLAGVPDGGATVTLLGTALAGLGILGRLLKRI